MKPPARTYGDQGVAERLRRARSSAGFASARAGGGAHGWAPSSVHSHERAERALAPEDLRRYAAAYRADPRWISTGSGPEPGSTAADGGARMAPPWPGRFAPGGLGGKDVERLDRIEARTRLHRTGFRLGIARRLAAFRTASAACAHFGFVRSTYGGHEYGIKGQLPAATAAIYAEAFGVSAEWLLLQGPPHGLPDAVAAEVAAAEASAPLVRIDLEGDRDFWLREVQADAAFEACVANADPARRGDPVAVEASSRRATSRRLLARARSHGGSVALREVPLDALLAPDPPPSGPVGHWSVPADCICGAPAEDVVVAVLADQSSDLGLGPGDRILLDVGGASTGDILTWSRGSLRVRGNAAGPADAAWCDAKVLGRVLAVFRRLAGR